MARILSAAEIETAIAAGHSEIVVSPRTIVTALAREKAEALGVDVVVGTPATVASSGDIEVAARRLARRALIDGGGDLDRLEEVVAAVMTRLGDERTHICGCGEH